jgi:glycosyltransferase involved in cell wall biosynthesis
MKTPAVTLLMPVYNGEKYLREAMGSILDQTFKDFEFLIINDGSTDSSESIILSYSDKRIRYIKNESNLKLIKTLNKGIKLCNGKYIIRMDADDISHPERIKKQVDFMESHPDIGICGSWFESFGGIQNKTVKYKETHDEIMTKMLYQCHFCHPSIIIRNEIFDDLKMLFDEDYAHAEDYDFYIKASKKWKFHNIQEPLLKYRIHDDSVSKKYKSTQIQNSLKIKQRLFEDFNTKSSEIELEAFEALNHHNYNNINIGIEKIQDLLESLLLGNRIQNLVSQTYFENYLEDLWIHFCYHKTNLKTYKKSKILYSYKKAKKLGILKWTIKSIVKK